MAQKNNIRSIRFSDEMAELIDRQVGNTFTEKFENLITRCVWELPQKEEQVKRIQEQISQERQRLYQLQEITKEFRLLEQNINNAKRYLETVEWRAKGIADAVEKEGT